MDEPAHIGDPASLRPNSPAGPAASPGEARQQQSAAAHRAEAWLAHARTGRARSEAWLAGWLQSAEVLRGSLSKLIPRLPLALPSLRSCLRFALRGAAVVAGGLAVTVLTLVVLYRWVNPPVSTLMIGQSLAGTPIERTWVPLDRVSPHLVKAVVLSEDGGFCGHHGVDWGALKAAADSGRGGSTITMQVVKNLFLWPSRSYVRKAIEIGLAYLVEAIWPKRRILEIYLNVAEWGDGVFGAEAAARQHFGKAAARLTPQEAALLAVSLPNPIERTAGSPGIGTVSLAGRLMVRMAGSRASLTCVRTSRVETRPEPRPAPKPKPAQKGGQWDHLFPGRD